MSGSSKKTDAGQHNRVSELFRTDAKAALGETGEIRKSFFDLQRELYVT